MNTHPLTLAAVFLGLLAIAGHATADTPDLPTVVKQVMDDQYGAYDAKQDCWPYSANGADGDPVDYCMRPGKPVVLEERGAQVLYLTASNLPDNVNYSYSQAQPGMLGAFKLKLGGPQNWVYMAWSKGLESGLGGQCQCEDAQLVQLDNAGDRGWLYTSGGTWQGVTVANYSLIKPIKAQMKDISKIPQIREDDQTVNYTVSVKPDTTLPGLYPLHVVKSKSGKTVDEFDVAFDGPKGVYALPAGR